MLVWLGLLASPAVERLLPEGWPLPLGLALLAVGAGMARRWERLPGAGALARLGEADPFSRRVIALTLGFYLGLRAILLLDGSFGADYDSFRVANAAALLWREGRYQVSRFPGYPVPEIALSPLVALGGPVLAKLGAAAEVHKAARAAYDQAFQEEVALREEHRRYVDRLMGEVRAAFPGDRARQDIVFPQLDESGSDDLDEAEAPAEPAEPAEPVTPG